MSNLPREVPDGVVTISSSEEGRCCVEVDPKSAQSLIRFLLDQGIRLDPPEGGVARDPKYQVEMVGVPQMHKFHALASADEIEGLAAEWKSIHPGRFPEVRNTGGKADPSVKERIWRLTGNTAHPSKRDDPLE